MIDWHSHILPCVDDGSRNVEESIKLLNLLAEQGVKTVVATPHFIADNESATSFINRRNTAFNKLKDFKMQNNLNIVLGAEVQYYPGISRFAELKKLCIENTNLLLLEMPISIWTEYTVKELIEIANTKNITLILAHIERPFKLQPIKNIKRLIQEGILMQSNATFFVEARTKRKALSLLKNGYIHFLGSDCHNLHSRPPVIGRAMENIKNKLGEDFICQMNEYGNSILI